VNEILAFNGAIRRLRLVEIPLKGCKYTWTNKQQNPMSSDLKITGYSMSNSPMSCNMVGAFPLSTLTKQKPWGLNSKT
jgi:hypothetical protein